MDRTPKLDAGGRRRRQEWSETRARVREMNFAKFFYVQNEVTKGTGHDTRSTISTTAGASFAVVRKRQKSNCRVIE